MSEGSFWPRTWKEALPLSVWGILIFAAGFEGVASLVHGEWISSGASFAIMLGLTAMLLHWKAWLERANANWVAGAAVALIIAIAVSPFVREGQWPTTPWESVGVGVLGTLIVASFVGAISLLFITGKRPSSAVTTPLQTATSLQQIDNQTRLDLIHLLDFALNQSALVLLQRLIDLAFEPEITSSFKNGENSPEAQQSRRFYIGYVGQEIAGNFDRRQLYLQMLANTESEVDRTLDENQRLEGETIGAFRQRLVLEWQFDRAIQFLHHQRREIEETIRGQRGRLAERLQYRQQGSAGG